MISLKYFFIGLPYYFKRNLHTILKWVAFWIFGSYLLGAFLVRGKDVVWYLPFIVGFLVLKMGYEVIKRLFNGVEKTKNSQNNLIQDVVEIWQNTNQKIKTILNNRVWDFSFLCSVLTKIFVAVCLILIIPVIIVQILMYFMISLIGYQTIADLNQPSLGHYLVFWVVGLVVLGFIIPVFKRGHYHFKQCVKLGMEMSANA